MNHARFIFALVFFSTLVDSLDSGRFTSAQPSSFQKQLDQFAGFGLTYEQKGHDLVEVGDPGTGFKRLKLLCQPDLKQITTWADARGIPILEIDPTTIDTSQYAGWYSYWVELPVSNEVFGPILVDDIDQDGAPDIYGIYKDYTSDYIARVYEIDSNGTVSAPLFDYYLGGGIALGFADADQDGYPEFVLQEGDSVIDFEQPSLIELPTQREFTHVMWEYPGTSVWTRTSIGNMDNDSLTDFLYRGTEIDSSVQGFVYKTYVAEYDPNLGNFLRVWSAKLSAISESILGGYTVGDFDIDGLIEFVASELYGNVHLVENRGNNNYVESWTDSLPFVNVYYQTSGDVDNDGKPEFFVGATMSDGNWTTVYEADSNDHYSPRFLFHLLSGGSLDEPAYLTSDVDGDGVPELIIFSGVDLYVFKGAGDDSYALWYYKREDAKHSVQVYDFNGDGIKDIIISKGFNNGQGLRFYADVYVSNPILSVRGNESLPQETRLYQNFPNPFNPSTTIQYSVPQRSHVTLKVYNMLGQEVATLVDGEQEAGSHKVDFAPTGVASSAYFYRLEARPTDGGQAGGFDEVKKLIIVK